MEKHKYIKVFLIVILVILLLWLIIAGYDLVVNLFNLNEKYYSYNWLYSKVGLDFLAVVKPPSKPTTTYKEQAISGAVEVAPITEEELQTAIEGQKELAIFVPEEEKTEGEQSLIEITSTEIPTKIEYEQENEAPTSIPLPKIFTDTNKTRGKTFVLYPGYDIQGHTTFTASTMANVSPDLMNVCFSMGDRCVAFNTAGELKNYFDPTLLVPKTFGRDVWLGNQGGLIVRMD